MRLGRARAKAEGGVDVLVNNAGRGYYGSAANIAVRDLEALLALNVVAPLRLAQLALDPLTRTGGTIVMISSVAGVVASPRMGAYAASKFALEALSMSLRAELVGTGVRVVVVRPGPVDTPFRAHSVTTDGRAGVRPPGAEVQTGGRRGRNRPNCAPSSAGGRSSRRRASCSLAASAAARHRPGRDAPRSAPLMASRGALARGNARAPGGRKDSQGLGVDGREGRSVTSITEPLSFPGSPFLPPGRPGRASRSGRSRCRARQLDARVRAPSRPSRRANGADGALVLARGRRGEYSIIEVRVTKS